MGKGTGIQWSDDTVNPTDGCDGCELWIPGQGGPCYAGNFHETRLAKSLPQLYDQTFTNVRMIPGRMAKAARCMDLTGITRQHKPWLGTLRRKVFAGDLGDIFSAAVTFDFLKQEIIDVATGPFGSRHDFQLLTKQPQRASQFATWLTNQGINWPENVWIGISITSKASLPRIQHLVGIPALHRFLSIEPLVSDPGLTPSTINGIDWMIVGGESDQGPRTARPFHIEWTESIIDLGRATKTAASIKQMGSRPWWRGRPVSFVDHHGGDWNEWDPSLRVRQMSFGCL